MHPAHRVLLKEIEKHAGKAALDPFLDNYFGNKHPKHKIKSATLRNIARTWIRANTDLTPEKLAIVLTSLMKGRSCTEKLLAGVILDSSRKEQRAIKPVYFDRWLNYLEGWVEIDTLCTGKYASNEVPAQWTAWKKQLNAFSRSSSISKRRASLVLLCSPLRKHADKRLLDQALRTVDKLAPEKEVLITKAISWVLRCAIPHFPGAVKKYLTLNKDRLPKIAVRETLTKLTTGTKTKRKSR